MFKPFVQEYIMDEGVSNLAKGELVDYVLTTKPQIGKVAVWVNVLSRTHNPAKALTGIITR